MVTITLPPELEQAITQEALLQGTTAEQLVLVELQQRFSTNEKSGESSSPAQSLAEYLKDYIGCIDSSTIIPGGAQMSIDCGKKFAEGMAEKHAKGKL